ncbi:hypothetical protein CCHL11_06344 [Colletotrichum chlorophyti]|uniref:Uncharacterized protein n=1 Tax=Colletotrichum chlorophyti TaxID=708187 RepID=A0A1Q8RPY7_9PEZI|nr:hypothetical protein CCHL11_06344 [Colletotrichum chlorophyti]
MIWAVAVPPVASVLWSSRTTGLMTLALNAPAICIGDETTRLKLMTYIFVALTRRTRTEIVMCASLFCREVVNTLQTPSSSRISRRKPSF